MKNSNRMKIILFHFLSMCGVLYPQTQSLYPSAVKIETEINKKMINAHSSSTILQVNEATSEIAVRIDIFSIKTGNDTLDTLLQKLNNTTAVFLKGNFPIKNLSFVSKNNEEQRDYSGKAQLTINGITKEQDYTCVVYNLRENDGLTENNNTAYPLNINLFFEFEPEKFKLNELFKPLMNGVKIEVANGFINKLSANSPNLFK